MPDLRTLTSLDARALAAAAMTTLLVIFAEVFLRDAFMAGATVMMP